MARRRPSRSSSRPWRGAGAGLLAALALAAGCATVAPPTIPPSPEAAAARALIEQRGAEFKDLRTLAEILIRKDNRRQRLTGPLLLRAPSSLRFEALSAFGTPVVVVGGDPSAVTVWEVLDRRAYRLPATPDATRGWLGLALGVDDLVAVLSGHVVLLKNPRTVELLAADERGPSLSLTGADGAQRVWFDAETGQVRQVMWTGGKDPARAVFSDMPPDAPSAGVMVTTLDGTLEVTVTYQDPRVNTGFEADLMPLDIPEDVKIQDFR